MTYTESEVRAAILHVLWDMTDRELINLSAVQIAEKIISLLMHAKLAKEIMK